MLTTFDSYPIEPSRLEGMEPIQPPSASGNSDDGELSDSSSCGVPHMLSPGYDLEDDQDDDMSNDSVESVEEVDYPSSKPERKTNTARRLPVFGKFEMRKNTKESNEDLELMTITVLDGDPNSEVEPALVKVSENVHVLRQSSLQASRQAEAAKKSKLLDDGRVEMKKDITNLSPHSVASFDVNVPTEDNHSEIYHTRTHSRGSHTSSKGKFHFDGDSPEPSYSRQQSSHSGHSGKYLASRQHKRDNSNGSYNHILLPDRSIFRPTRSRVQSHSLQFSPMDPSFQFIYNQHRRTKTWSYNDPMNQATVTPISAPTPLPTMNKLYPRKTPSQAIFKSTASPIHHQHGLLNTRSLSTGSHTETAILENVSYEHFEVDANNHNSNERDANMPSLLETIQDNSPYTSPIRVTPLNQEQTLQQQLQQYQKHQKQELQPYPEHTKSVRIKEKPDDIDKTKYAESSNVQSYKSQAVESHCACVIM